MGKKLKHLEMIQNIINRLSQNSFLLKGWNVLLISALFTLSANNSNIFYVYLAFFPAIAFWILDGYFLRQEKLFRKLYDFVRLQEEEKIDFAMNTKIVGNEVASWICIIFSNTLLIFHGTIFLSIIIVILIFLVFNNL